MGLGSSNQSAGGSSSGAKYSDAGEQCDSSCSDSSEDSGSSDSDSSNSGSGSDSGDDDDQVGTQNPFPQRIDNFANRALYGNERSDLEGMSPYLTVTLGMA